MLIIAGRDKNVVLYLRDMKTQSDESSMMKAN